MPSASATPTGSQRIIEENSKEPLHAGEDILVATGEEEAKEELDMETKELVSSGRPLVTCRI